QGLRHPVPISHHGLLLSSRLRHSIVERLRVPLFSVTKGPLVLPSVAVVGATGAVGEIMRQVLIEHKFGLRGIKFLASPRSAGKPIDFAGKQYPVEPLRPDAFAGIDIVLSSTPATVSREYSPIAARAGAI